MVFRCRYRQFTRALNEDSEHHTWSRISLPFVFEPMLIKPTYDKFYRIVYTRGKDKQTTDIVEATEEQVKDLVTVVIKGRTFHPAGKSGVIPSTNVQLWEYNSLTKQTRLCREFPKVYNQSPRNIRTKIEKAVNTGLIDPC